MNHGYYRHSPTFLFRLWHPMSWPRAMRRTFVLLLPLALPVWLLLNLAGVLGVILRDWGRGLGQFWNGRQRRYHGDGGDYGYARERRDDEGVN